MPLYSPLQENEIRLISLRPEKNDTTGIYCTLKHEKRSSYHFYEAVSYCWGDRSADKEIFLNDVCIKVTNNLWCTLHQLRRKDRQRILWIDALSINQDDLNERSRQVKRMHEIYSNAASVVISLCEEVENTEYTIQFLKNLEAHILAEKTNPSATLKTIIDRYIKDINGWTQVLLLYKDPYWNRLWVFQEIVLAYLIEIVWKGQSINWETLVTVKQYIQDHADEIYRKIGTFHEGLNAMLSAGPAQFQPYRIQHRDSPVAKFDLFKIIQSRVSSHCSNNQDKVYGFLGVAAQYADRFNIDYKKPVNEIYRELVDIFISDRLSLDIICLVRRVHSGNYGYSSWIPALDGPIVPALPMGMFNACRGTSSYSKPTSSWELHVEGIFLHKLEHLSDPVPDTKNTTWIHLLNKTPNDSSVTNRDSDPVMVTLRKWMRLITEYAQRTRGSNEMNLWSIFQSTLGSDIFEKSQEQKGGELFTSPSDNQKLYISAIPPNFKFNPPKLTLMDLRKWINDNFIYIAAHIQHRRFSIGNAKIPMGLVPSSSEVRDEIYILAGCNVPVVLRKHGMAPGSVRYQLLGDAYVHGFMHGEAITGDSNGFQKMILV